MSTHATVFRFLRELTATSRGRALSTAALALAVAATEGLGLVLLFPLLEIAGVGGTGGALSNLGRQISSAVGLAGGSAAPTVLAVYAIVMTGRAMLVRWSAITGVRLQEEFLLARRRRLFGAILGARWQAVLGRRAGTLTHALTAELEAAADAPTHLLAILTGTLITLVYLAVAVRLSLTITLLAALAGVGLLLLLQRSRRIARAASSEVHRQTTELFAAAAEQVDGLKSTKAFGAERESERVFGERSISVAKANERSERLFADARALLDAGAVVLLALAVWIALGVSNLGAQAILILLYLFARLTPRLAALQSAYQRLMLAMPPFASVAQTIDSCERAAESRAPDGTPCQLREAIVLRDVTYSYPDAGTQESAPPPPRSDLLRAPALRGVTLSIEAGATTAVVGSSGAGKSTLADLVLGLLHADSGRVEIDGVALTPERARSWRARVGYVGQDTYLFNDTIRANLRWACPDATADEMSSALALAAADGFLSTLPAGLDTVVGERGHRLSTGERQRIALARALLRRSELLILDEATSAVDAENERAIQQAVESLRGRMTLLVITHRLTTVRAADVIYVMDRGRIVEHGSFERLLSRGGRFSLLCEAQGGTLVEQRVSRLALVGRT